MLIDTWGQETPNWVCPGGPIMWAVVYLLIIPGIIYAAGICTHSQDIVFPNRDLLGGFLFFFGSAYSLSYEVARFKWKKNPNNRLHTEGLARFCIHPNYFGDLFTYSGWALCAGTTCALSASPGMVWSFVYFVCPNSDAYLAKRYEGEFGEYSRRVSIPGLRNWLANQVLAWVCFGVSCWLGANCAGQCPAPKNLDFGGG